MKGLDRLLEKNAQEEQETEIAAPEEDSQETIITCLSDCMYSQNPEKTCMLKNVSLNMDKPGIFQCGQYTSQQAAELMVAGGSRQTSSPGQEQAKGLDKTKSPAQSGQ